MVGIDVHLLWGTSADLVGMGVDDSLCHSSLITDSLFMNQTAADQYDLNDQKYSQHSQSHGAARQKCTLYVGTFCWAFPRRVNFFPTGSCHNVECASSLTHNTFSILSHALVTTLPIHS